MLADFPHLADFAREQADLAGCSAVDGWREDCARVARALRRSGASPRSLAQAGAVLQSFEVLSGLLREIAEWVGDARGVGILRGVRIQEFGSFSECARNSGILDTINQARRAIRTFEQKEGTP